MKQNDISITNYDQRSELLKQLRILIGPVGQDWNFFTSRRSISITFKNEKETSAVSWIYLKYKSEITTR